MSRRTRSLIPVRNDKLEPKVVPKDPSIWESSTLEKNHKEVLRQRKQGAPSTGYLTTGSHKPKAAAVIKHLVSRQNSGETCPSFTTVKFIAGTVATCDRAERSPLPSNRKRKSEKHQRYQSYPLTLPVNRFQYQVPGKKIPVNRAKLRLNHRAVGMRSKPPVLVDSWRSQNA